MFANKKGFTLIEVMVVITIIGILSTIALYVNRQAVEKSKGAKIESGLKSIGTQAQVIYNKNGSYKKLCSNTLDPAIVQITNNINTAGSVFVACNDNNYIFLAVRGDANDYEFYCTDTSGSINQPDLDYNIINQDISKYLSRNQKYICPK